jgi:hypothetical protein
MTNRKVVYYHTVKPTLKLTPSATAASSGHLGEGFGLETASGGHYFRIDIWVSFPGPVHLQF